MRRLESVILKRVNVPPLDKKSMFLKRANVPPLDKKLLQTANFFPYCWLEVLISLVSTMKAPSN